MLAKENVHAPVKNVELEPLAVVKPFVGLFSQGMNFINREQYCCRGVLWTSSIRLFARLLLYNVFE